MSDELFSIKDFIEEKIKPKEISEKIFQLFNIIQNLLEKDENITRGGYLKSSALNLIKNRLKELFEENINELEMKIKKENK